VHFVAINAGVTSLVKPVELDAASLKLPLPAAAARCCCSPHAARNSKGDRPAPTALLVLYPGYIAAAVAVAP
jgi:hypothetical protein